jgi:hypothetical protein
MICQYSRTCSLGAERKYFRRNQKPRSQILDDKVDITQVYLGKTITRRRLKG